MWKYNLLVLFHGSHQGAWVNLVKQNTRKKQNFSLQLLQADQVQSQETGGGEGTVQPPETASIVLATPEPAKSVSI